MAAQSGGAGMTHFHCCDEVDANEAYERGRTEGYWQGVRDGQHKAVAPPHNPAHDSRDCPECDHWIALRDGSFAHGYRSTMDEKRAAEAER